MTALAQAFVRLRPDVSGFKSDAERGIDGAGLGKLGDKHGKAFGGAFTASAGKMLAGVGGLLAAIGVASFFKDSIAEAREAVKVGKITEAAIRSTGGAAKVSAAQIGDLATALSYKVGVDDEAIQSGENLLLTFTRVRNEAGRGNDVFNQASGAIVDMTAAMNNGVVTQEGLKASTIQVGKALNDPIKGMTALSKVGVTFTAQQKEQIKGFVESGNIMGAQKVILRELTTEFGGAAAAAADPAQRATVIWANFKEMIGGLVLPILNQLVLFMATVLLPLIQNKIIPFVQMAGAAFVAAFRDGDVTSDGFIGTLERLGGVVGMVWRQVQAFWAGLTQGADASSGTLQQLGNVLRTVVIPAIAAFIGWIGQAVGWLTSGSEWAGLLRAAIAGAAGAILIAAGVIKIITTAQMLWNLAMALNPIGLVVIAIGALVAGVIYAWTHFAGFRDVVIAVWDALKTGALAVWSVLQPVFQAIGAAALWLWQNVLYPSFTGWKLIIENVVIPVVLFLWHNVIEPAFQAIAFWVKFAWQVASVIFELWRNYIANVVGPIILWLWHNVVEPWGRGMIAVVTQVWANLQPIFAAIGNFITDRLVPAFQRGVQAIGVAWNGLREAARAPVAFVVNFVANPLIRGFNRVASAFGVKTRVDEIGGFAAGGHVRGPGSGTSDQVPIWASNGEYVIPARTVRRMGVGFFDQLIGRPRPGTKYPGDGSGGLAFALGGLIDFGKDIWATVTDPARIIKGPAEAALRAVPGGGMVRDMAIGAGRKLLDAVLSFVGGGGGGGDVGRARALLLAANGKPYGWAQAGPGSFDCSGIVSMVWNALHGRPPYSHTFSTGNEAGFFPKAGFGGVLTAGWTNPGEPGPGGSSVGHTAAILAGLPFESTGGRGVHVGAGVTPVNAFAHVGHYARGGVVPGPAGRAQAAIVHGGERITPAGQPIELGARTIRELAAAIAAGVGGEINHSGRSMVQLARAR